MGLCPRCNLQRGSKQHNLLSTIPLYLQIASALRFFASIGWPCRLAMTCSNHNHTSDPLRRHPCNPKTTRGPPSLRGKAVAIHISSTTINRLRRSNSIPWAPSFLARFPSTCRLLRRYASSLQLVGLAASQWRAPITIIPAIPFEGTHTNPKPPGDHRHCEAKPLPSILAAQQSIGFAEAILSPRHHPS